MPSASPAIIRPVLLCGGAGTRLWPVSRRAFPKQLISLVGEGSLLQQTALRICGDGFAPAIIVSGEEQGPFVKEQLEKCGAPVDAILLEPMGRNTAAAATLAAAWVQAKGGDDLLLLMPSDHVIGDREAFMAAIETGIPHAENGAIVTLGVTPNEPNTQYGYIEATSDQPSPDGASPIARFHEKPTAEKAAEYLASGGFFWNAGIFLAKASTILGEMRRFLPGSLDHILQAVADARTDDVFIRPADEAFGRAENISIDHGIMEKTGLGVVVPVQMDWSDVGSWDAVWKLGEKDDAENVKSGEVLAVDTSGSLLRSEGGVMIATLGLQKMAVIAVKDAVLVAPLDRMAELKTLVDQLKADSK